VEWDRDYCVLDDEEEDDLDGAFDEMAANEAVVQEENDRGNEGSLNGHTIGRAKTLRYRF